MAVTDTVILPNQPSPAGNVLPVQLGGNGFSAPKFMYVLKNFASAGDATGGVHELNVRMDPAYTTLVGHVTMQVAVAAANMSCQWAVTSDQVAVQLENLTLERISSTIGSQIAHTWLPPAFVNPGGGESPTLSIRILNVDTEILNLQGTFFLFDIRARESALWQHLIASRGGMYSSQAQG